MKRLLFVTPYPHNSIEMSACIRGYFDQYRAMGYEVTREKIYFWENKLFYSLKWLALLRYLFLPAKAFMLHQHTIAGSGPLIIVFLVGTRLMRRRTIVVSHETVGTYAKHLPRFLRWVAYAYEWMVVVFSDAFVVHTKMHFDEIASFAPVKHVHIIPHPVPVTVERLPQQKTTWGFYGMISHKKGVDLLIEAYQHFPAGRLPPLRIMGRAAPNEATYEQECKAMVLREFSSLITFTGFIPDDEKKTYFADIGLMVFPYRYLSQSGALAETCMYGIPYLASDLPFFIEFHTAFGGGRLFTNDSVVSLQSELDFLADNPMKITEEQWRNIRDTLSIEKCAGRIKEIIEG